MTKIIAELSTSRVSIEDLLPWCDNFSPENILSHLIDDVNHLVDIARDSYHNKQLHMENWCSSIEYLVNDYDGIFTDDSIRELTGMVLDILRTLTKQLFNIPDWYKYKYHLDNVEWHGTDGFNSMKVYLSVGATINYDFNIREINVAANNVIYQLKTIIREQRRDCSVIRNVKEVINRM